MKDTQHLRTTRPPHYFYIKILSSWPWPWSDSRPISTNMSNINEIPQWSWWYSYINLNTKNFDFFLKLLSPWHWPQGHPWGGDGADKNYRPISTIMPNMNEIHPRVFKIWGLINFNAKTDPVTERRTNERMYEGTNGWMEKRKHYTLTYFVCRGYNNFFYYLVSTHWIAITKTHLSKYTENFTTKKVKFSDKKLISFIFLLKMLIVGTR